SNTGSSVRARVPFVPIHERKALRLPGGGRIILWLIVNIESWSPEKPMPRTVLPPPMGQPMLPDVPNWAWHEYGMRVGYWRFLEAIRSRNLQATVAVNGSAFNVYPEACKAAHDAGWEFIGHGYVQAPMHTVADEQGDIVKTIDAIQEFTGIRPRGWESPGLTETDKTVDLLAEAGIEYVANWVLDDQPVHVNTRSG